MSQNGGGRIPTIGDLIETRRGADTHGPQINSVCFDPPNSSAALCHETGAYCEANRLGERVVASVCVSRSAPGRRFLILAPCGICQERLALWGGNVELAVAVPGAPHQWQSRRLSHLQPHYWRHEVEDAGEAD